MVQDDEDGHHHDLGNQEGRLGTRRSQHMEGRDLHEQLGDQDEHFQMEGEGCRYGVYLPPRAGEMLDVARGNSDRSTISEMPPRMCEGSIL